MKAISYKIFQINKIRLGLITFNNGFKKFTITLKSASKILEKNNEQTIELRKNYSIHFSNNAPNIRQKIVYIDETGFIITYFVIKKVQKLIHLQVY